jgi:hydrogenase nickel incorporation protein HypB
VRIQAEHQEHSHAVNGSHTHEHSHGVNDSHTHSHEHPAPSHHHHDGTDQTHSHHSDRPHIHPKRQTISLETNILAKNDRLAERNRGYFLAKNLTVFNLLSSPGSGKTALLERTITDLQEQLKIGIIVGDLETDNDAERLRKTGAPAVQILTGTLCHLEADMILEAAQKLPLDTLNMLVVENVGNLVCPAAYDLGETVRIALLSVTEGEDKPLKYPTLFKSIDLAIITKIDLAEAVGFDRSKAITNLKRMAPQAEILEVSARTGAGMQAWYTYLSQTLSQAGGKALAVA